MQVLDISLDTPLKFKQYKCKLCGREDAKWLIMQFLSDGFWRTLLVGKTLREQGIDGDDIHRIYCVHGCSEEIIRSLKSLYEIAVFNNSLKGEK